MDPTTTTDPSTWPTAATMPRWPTIEKSRGFTIWSVLATVSFAASVYHGYKRNENGPHPVAWAVGWGILGALFPVITPTIAIAEGYGKPKRKGR